MKRYRFYLAVITLLSCFALTTKAQTDAGELVKSGIHDANTLMGGYADPLMKSLGAGINGGWFQTAKPHGLGGFDITICANPIFIPTSAKTYDVSTLPLERTRVVAGQSPIAPTVFGSSQKGPEMEIHDKSPFTGNDTSVKIGQLPGGLNSSLFAVPTAQITVGVGAGTDVSIRFVPKFGVKDMGIGMFGFAIKHDIKQWIPVIKELPFDLSGMFGYTSLNANVDLSGDNAIKPESDPGIYNPNPSKSYSNQKIDFKTKAWTINLLVSKKLGPFTPYLGLGYQRSTTQLDMKGDYPVTVPNDPNSATNPTDPSFGKAWRVQDVTDPVSVKGTLSGARATIGARLKLAVLTLHADYTFASYKVLSVGIGLNVQSLVPPSL